MEEPKKHQLRALHYRLGSLLSQRQALNSKVVSRNFDYFIDAIEEDADAVDIKSRLNRLEQALKQEGLFKNVKTEFQYMKKEVVAALYTHEVYHPKHTLPGLVTAKDRTFYVPPKTMDDQAIAPAPTRMGGVSSEDMRLLNNAVAKLFRHLQMTARDPEFSKFRDNRDEQFQKENVNILTINHGVQQEETFHDIVLKIRSFEKEFQRHKVSQNQEIMRLQEEIKYLNKNAYELKRENERFKGIQPIVTKAKGKQVERLEERYRTEKKGMEVKLTELEAGIRKSMEQAYQDKDGIQKQVRYDLEKIVSSINHLHYTVLDTEEGGRTSYAAIKLKEHTDMLPTAELLQRLNVVTGSVQALTNKNHELNSKVHELSAWKKSLKELDKEITRFCRTFGNIDATGDKKKEPTTTLIDIDPQDIAYSCKTKLQKTRDNLNTKMKNVDSSNVVVRRKDKDLAKLRKSVEELQTEIAKLHDTMVSVSLEDISLAMPRMDGLPDTDRSDFYADDLPESDRHGQLDHLHKLKQVGTMVTHFQQLILNRTGTMHSMENDLLPLRIRINRLHGEICKAMKTDTSPDYDSTDERDTPKREFSPGGTEFSKEINKMLSKLTKMELSIRHLLNIHFNQR